MSESYGIGMASAAMADGDGDGGDADNLGEEGHSGGGPTEDDNRNRGVDSDEQQKEEGGMAEATADEVESAQAGADSEPEADGDGDDSEDSGDRGDPLGDGYQEHGHPVVAATGVTVADGCVGVNDIEARFPLGTTEATKELTLSIIGRIITPHQVTDLIRQQGADPNVVSRLRKKGSMRNWPGSPPSKCRGRAHSLLCLAIDNLSDNAMPTIRAEADEGASRPAVLPQWSSAGLQEAVMTALIDGGADINTPSWFWSPPLQRAICAGNETAFKLLMERPGIRLRGGGLCVLSLWPPESPVPPEYEKVLMSMYERLIREDPTLATEGNGAGGNLVREAALRARGYYSKSFIDAYLDLITQHGADMTEAVGIGWTPLCFAAVHGSPQVADHLCRKLPADQINGQDNRGHTPLAMAAEELDRRTRELQDPETPEHTKERNRAESDRFKLTIRSLLRAAADINLIPTATEDRRRERQLVLTEYATVLNKVGPAVMSAVNAALAPHRSLAALLTLRLAVGPQEAPIFGRRIASYLFDMDAAQEAISEAIGVRRSDMARRVCAAAEHFVHSAVYRASSNREVVGGTADVGGQVVRVPQLQCFVVGGVGGRKMELREVVQRAILDEAAKWGLAGEIDNGFSKDVAAVVWVAVGWVEKRRDGRETFRSLQLT
ncbi:unnamed protein product [Vitrella brassicaformis CCMP3155]|uniref:Uncharacterized protein n=1 Tax=Vitrella brassicaformis (strain CCMP3155) TaxID=1169540 RepID=A0A0G4EBR6_VITBC|nr:unnamed protein product [Vitrella brassicaformis CCMP3155]|eukprot:CEL93418.1 unnamed protein product [Vitrella brassicaformis CCMP3155]